MPELPEVETTLRGITPHIKLQQIEGVIVRHHGLRWPVPPKLKELLTGQMVINTSRRGKYLLLETPTGTLILHLGMSGSLRILTQFTPPQKHDHLDIEFSNHKILRFTDPRRFGALLWVTGDPMEHVLLNQLGPEPFSDAFTGRYLSERAAKRKVPVKSFIMDSKTVVGVGNIYAAEALFMAGMHPTKAAGRITVAEYNVLVRAIQKILTAAIEQGGTTLKDFAGSDGKPGYFRVKLKVYGRGGLPCVKCKTELKEIRLGQRSTVFCPHCQKK